MNVDVLNRSGAPAGRFDKTRHRRLRRASARPRDRDRRRQPRPPPIPVAPLAGTRGGIRGQLSPALGKGLGLPERPAARLPAGRLAARRIPRQQFELHGRAAPGPEQRGARHPEPAEQRSGRPECRAVRRPHPRHQRMAGGGMDLARRAAEGLRAGPLRRRRRLGPRDRAAGGRSQLRPGAAAEPHRRPAGQPALLADL